MINLLIIAYAIMLSTCIKAIEMKTTVTKRDGILVIGKELRTNNSRLHKLTQFWKKFNEENELAKIPEKIDPHTTIAVYTNYATDQSGDYSLIIGSPVKNIEHVPSGSIALDIPAASYAVVTARGPIPEAIGKAWAYIWSDQFPYERTFTNDFELYDPTRLQAETPEVDIYVAIKN